MSMAWKTAWREAVHGRCRAGAVALSRFRAFAASVCSALWSHSLWRLVCLPILVVAITHVSGMDSRLGCDGQGPIDMI